MLQVKLLFQQLWGAEQWQEVGIGREELWGVEIPTVLGAKSRILAPIVIVTSRQILRNLPNQRLLQNRKIQMFPFILPNLPHRQIQIPIQIQNVPYRKTKVRMCLA